MQVRVAPYTGAWIEIAISARIEALMWSLPTRERGLKSCSGGHPEWHIQVAPYTGAWIEIPPNPRTIQYSAVAPYTGAWIEINSSSSSNHRYLVAPYTGAWIEIM